MLTYVTQDFFSRKYECIANAEVNFIWSIANKLRGSYMPDKYGDVIISMVIIRRFECTLEKTRQAVVDMFEKMPTYPSHV